MNWKTPPKIKIHEALGCIGDKRIEMDGNTAKVYSSSRGKFYEVEYDSTNNAIMANDNGSYWKEYLGYPAIAFLMLKGILRYDPKYAEALKDIAWKDINQKFKNDFSKTEEHILNVLKNRGVNIEDFNYHVDEIFGRIKIISVQMLGKKKLPPKGY